MELNTGNPSLYKIWKIPKIKEGRFRGWRTIEEPCEELKHIQRDALKVFEKFPHHPAVHGIKGTSTLQNAAAHHGQPIIIKLDIKDFFPSTHMEMTRWRIRNHRLPEESQMLFLLDYCFIRDPKLHGDRRLPQGAPTSPILASIAFSHQDYQLAHLAKQYELTYTRYVDDLTFSGLYRPQGFVREVSRIIKPYILNWEKVESAHRGYQRQEVTGIVINEKISVPRTVRHNLRARLDQFARAGKELDEETDGLLSYIRSVSKDQYDSLVQLYGRRLQYYRSKAQQANTSSQQGLSSNPTDHS